VSQVLDAWNALPEEAAISEMLEHCGSRAWAAAMVRARPASDPRALFDAADLAWARLEEEDRKEAFAAHPRIGDRAAAGKGAREQAGTADASQDTLDALVDANRAYEQRFGRIFLVCATGRTADEMLAVCRQRLHNDPDTEFAVASEEQRKITRLRLEKWLHSLP
jgi:2-oxo-4-hydroxy-4-carboxy-5-ureidoimidazoline decarboxylase